MNCNGIQDPSEPGVEGVTVELRKDGRWVATTTTDANGAYSFSNVLPGTYTVVFKKPFGFDFTAPGQGNDLLLDSKVTNAASGSTDPLTILPGKSFSNIDAGLCQGVRMGMVRQWGTGAGLGRRRVGRALPGGWPWGLPVPFTCNAAFLVSHSREPQPCQPGKCQPTDLPMYAATPSPHQWPMFLMGLTTLEVSAVWQSVAGGGRREIALGPIPPPPPPLLPLPQWSCRWTATAGTSSRWPWRTQLHAATPVWRPAPRAGPSPTPAESPCAT